MAAFNNNFKRNIYIYSYILYFYVFLNLSSEKPKAKNVFCMFNFILNWLKLVCLDVSTPRCLNHGFAIYGN